MSEGGEGVGFLGPYPQEDGMAGQATRRHGWQQQASRLTKR